MHSDPYLGTGLWGAERTAPGKKPCGETTQKRLTDRSPLYRKVMEVCEPCVSWWRYMKGSPFLRSLLSFGSNMRQTLREHLPEAKGFVLLGKGFLAPPKKAKARGSPPFARERLCVADVPSGLKLGLTLNPDPFNLTKTTPLNPKP